MKKGDFMSPRSKKGCGNYSKSNPARRRDAIKRHKKEWEKTERCKRIRRNNYIAKSSFLLNCKAQFGCRKCKANNPVILLFHHMIPKEKKFNLGADCSCRSWDAILKEIEKCEILCLNHHAIEHDGLWNWKLKKDSEIFDKDKNETEEKQLIFSYPFKSP